MDQVCDWFASIFWSVDHLYFSRPRYHKISCSVLLKKNKNCHDDFIYQEDRTIKDNLHLGWQGAEEQRVVPKKPIDQALFTQPCGHWINLLHYQRQVVKSLPISEDIFLFKGKKFTDSCAPAVGRVCIFADALKF